MNRLSLAVHVVHQQILAKSVRRREVRLAAHLGHLLNEVHLAVAGQDEGIDRNARLLAAIHFFESLADHQGGQRRTGCAELWLPPVSSLARWSLAAVWARPIGITCVELRAMRVRRAAGLPRRITSDIADIAALFEWRLLRAKFHFSAMRVSRQLDAAPQLPG
jgi:hypothetical protein